MRYVVKVADAVCGIGYSRHYWTLRGAESCAKGLRREFGRAVWILPVTRVKTFAAWATLITSAALLPAYLLALAITGGLR